MLFYPDCYAKNPVYKHWSITPPLPTFSRVRKTREKLKKLTCYIYEQASPLIPVGRGPHVPQQRQPPDSSQAKGAEDRASVRQRRTWSDLDHAVPTTC